MKIIRQRQRITRCEYYLDYRWRDRPGSGFSFGCDENGKVNLEAMHPIGAANYLACINGGHDVIFKGLQKREWSYVEPAVGLCSCGTGVSLSGFTNTCDGCGADYNSSGTLLAPRSHWGEETGETAVDIMRGGDPFEK